MSAAAIIVEAIREHDVIGPAIAAKRCYHVDAVPRGAARPYVTYQVISCEEDEDLNGRVNGYTATADVQIVANKKAEVVALLDELPGLCRDIRNTTVAGHLVENAKAENSNDEPAGPADEHDGKAFIGASEISIYYGV